MTALDVDGSSDVALVPLVLLADVDDDRLARLDPATAFAGVALRDLGPHLLQELSIVRHRYRKYSFAPFASVAWDERACQGLDHRRARRRRRCGNRRRSHARHAERRPAAVEQAAALRSRSDGPARGGATGARSAAGVAVRHGSPAADSRRALPTQRPRPARARPCARAVGPAG